MNSTEKPSTSVRLHVFSLERRFSNRTIPQSPASYPRSFPGSSKDQAVTIPLGLDYPADDPQYSDVRAALLQYGHATRNLLVGGVLLAEAFRNLLDVGTQFLKLKGHRDRQLALFLALRQDYESQGYSDVVAYLDKHKGLLDTRGTFRCLSHVALTHYVTLAAVDEVRNAGG
jgi:hypothetical protein